MPRHQDLRGERNREPRSDPASRVSEDTSAAGRGPLLGCIADDFTGATDLANSLVRSGMRTVQMIGVPDQEIAEPGDAVVVALKSRTASVHEAVSQSLAALQWLRAKGCRQILFKYCSTFDSTEKGNIGPVIDALLEALGSDFTIACPASPENGRTIYRGHLFVGDALLNESGMENHPLTPMKDANLVRFLQLQTRSRVGLLRYSDVEAGAAVARQAVENLRSAKVRIAIADALSEAHLRVLGEVCADMPLVTGGAGIGIGLAANFAGLLGDQSAASRLPCVKGRSAIISGSCSRATNDQVDAWRHLHPAFKIDPVALANKEPVVDQAVSWSSEFIDRGPFLIYSTGRPEDVRAAQAKLGAAEASRLIEQALASIALRLHRLGVRRFVIAGGETAGAVVNALKIRALRIGPQIAPGVPWTVALGTEPVALALKSGNFGAADFFDRAFKTLDGGYSA